MCKSGKQSDRRWLAWALLVLSTFACLPAADDAAETVLTATKEHPAVSTWSSLIESPAFIPQRESAAPPFFGATARPLRTCVLITGERFHGELLRADSTAVEFRWHGHLRFRVPTAAVMTIENPPGVVDVLDEPVVVSQSLQVQPSVSDGIAQCWRDGHDEVRWTLRFGVTDLTIELTAEGSCRVDSPQGWTITFRQPVRPVTDRTCIAVRWTDTTWDVRIGPALHVRGDKPAAALSLIDVSAGLRDLTVRRFEQRPSTVSTPLVNGTRDAVVRADGDIWYGELFRTTQEGIALVGQNDDIVTIPWSEFSALGLRPRDNADTVLRPVSGRVAEFVGPSLWEPWRLPREQWIAAGRAWPSDVVDHPLLGPFAMNQGDVAQRRGSLSNIWAWLHPQPVHLGNHLQPEYRQPIPQGTRVAGTLTLITIPTGPAFISLDAVGLEPYGPGTPATTPFHAALQSGALRTTLLINGETVGDWNETLTHRPRPGQPVRLRLPIPHERLKLGDNRWEIRQSPLASDATEFDDCELSRIAFESK